MAEQRSQWTLTGALASPVDGATMALESLQEERMGKVLGPVPTFQCNHLLTQVLLN